MFIRRWPLNLAPGVRCWGIPLNILMNAVMPIPVAARSKAWVRGCLLLGILGLNTTGDMDVSVVC